MGEIEIFIEDWADSFTIVINGKRFSFDQEEMHRGLVDVFAELGFDAKYEECM